MTVKCQWPRDKYIKPRDESLIAINKQGSPALIQMPHWPAIDWSSTSTRCYTPGTHADTVLPREEPYTVEEIGKIMSYPPFYSLPGFLVPDSSKRLQPPRYCYGWVIPDFWWKVWGEADEKLMAWTQIKKQKKREECLLGDAIPEEWDPDYDDYVNYLVCVPDEKQIRINVARDWARRANVKLPLYDAPVVKVMANHKGHDLFVLYDNYTLDEGLTPQEIDTLRSVWTVNERVDPQWYPVLPVDGQEFRWTPS